MNTYFISFRIHIFLSICIFQILLYACVVMINENDYRGLSSKDHEQVKDFTLLKENQTVDNVNNLILYEINSNQIKEILISHSYTWIHLWRPYCSSQSCQLIDYYSKIKEKYKKYNVEFLLISETYDLFSIRNSLKENPYNDVIYVLSDSYYGHKLLEIRNKFFQDFIKNSNIEIRSTCIDFIFQDTILIYASENAKNQLFDSLIINLNQSEISNSY